ncbi:MULTISPECIES: glutathione transferase GstA [unclassified Rhizobium]|uniref:glutathione transferase GstA n=1 Tax=unclassified Rhizobium TaxID=2613769 RepID=UPI0006462E8B|nr:MULTISPECIES: glutathione transferase GstA [unclassified Rhizobium]MBN8954342.1 glutathione transferase GstA [Rhizobium tropici]OJY79102.1 MAG: glutathione transferase GstA [Rhizobium sp. 60-20]RKD67843.1 glutathione S-transferase [Rhizobium sp. WW_1]
MKLYYAPGVCSMAAHIVAVEAGIPLHLAKVDIGSEPHRLEDGRDLKAVSAKGVVPVLELDNGEVLTEGVAILLYLADQKPEAMLAPAKDSFERYRLQEWLTFISSELHKTFSPWLFHPEYGVQAADVARERLRERFQVLEAHLAKQDYLVGGRFSVADAYCFTIMNWSRGRGIDLSPWPHLAPYLSRIGERPGVHAALVAEGLRK